MVDYIVKDVHKEYTWISTIDNNICLTTSYIKSAS